MASKAKADDDFYTSELRRYGGGRGRGGGRGGRPAQDEKTLFGSQGPAGINFDQYNKIKVDRSGTGADQVPVLEAFSQLGGSRLPAFLSRNIKLMRYERPTPIQAHAIPLALAGRDLMCCAQTGSGKTCAFLLPVVSALGAPRDRKDQFVDNFAAAPAATVLAPTRELAIQIQVEAVKLCNRSGITSVVVYGGAKARGQLSELARGVDILVATPGRLQDFCNRRLVSLSRVKFLILDEADRMLDMGFMPQIRSLHRLMPAPASRATAMFSATFPPEIQRLARDFMREYVWIGVGRVGSTVASIRQRLLLATNNKREKLALLQRVMGETAAEDGSVGRTLVFVKKKSTARWVSRQLSRAARDGEAGAIGAPSAEIHGDRSQSQREQALARFRRGDVRVLVATDVAARGLDIRGVEHVVNFDLASTPDEFDSYVHRIGRTGRAGNEGLATSFYVPGYEAKVGCGRIAGQLLRLLRETKQEIPKWFMDLPEVRGSGGRGKQQQSRDIRPASSRRGGRPPAKRTSPSGGAAGGSGRGGRNQQQQRQQQQPPQPQAKRRRQQQQQQQGAAGGNGGRRGGRRRGGGRGGRGGRGNRRQ